MDKPVTMKRLFLCLLFLGLAFYSVHAFAAVESTGVLNNVLVKFETASQNWKTVMVARATWLFWLLVVISMVWTFGFMALRKADIGELFAEFIRFTIFTGFFWWLLLNGPKFAVDIINSMRQIGAQASGLPNDLGPSGIVDMGFDIFFRVIDQSTVWQPMDSLFGMLLGLAILIVFALIGVNMLLLLVSGYFLAYAGVFILGFGGSKWTSEMAIGYYKSILNIGLQLMAMILIIGVGNSFIDEYYKAMSKGIELKEMGVMAVVAACMLFLVSKVPPQIGALAGGSTGNMGSNFGVGAAVGAAAMGAAAVASAGAAVAAGAASAAGGTQAIMAAFAKASAAESAGGGSSAGLMSAASGGGAANDSAGSGSDLASAMGDSPSAGSAAASTSSGSDESSSSPSSGSSGGSSSDAGSNNTAASSNNGGNEANASQSSTGGGGSGASNAQSTAGRTANNNDSNNRNAEGGSTGQAPGVSGDSASPSNASGSGDKSSGLAKAGRIASGTATNLAQGAWDVAKSKAQQMRDSAQERINETTGGKIASAIKARQDSDESTTDKTVFSNDSLAAGTMSTEDQNEIAEFRDGQSKSA
jgi:type IV secretion system protein TrbL